MVFQLRDPNVGILNSIAPSEIVTVTFQVIVQSIPSVNPISNIARIDYTFIADPTAPIISRTITSNPAFTQISDANVLSLKAVNAQQATTGDILTYTITIPEIFQLRISYFQIRFQGLHS